MMFDARCGRCKAPIGWSGEVVDMPSCKKCGWTPNPATLLSDQKEMEEFRRLLALRAKDCSGHDLRKRRQAAGLTLTPVAERLQVTITVVSGWEQGDGKPNEEQAAILDRLYDGD